MVLIIKNYEVQKYWTEAYPVPPITIFIGCAIPNVEEVVDTFFGT